MNNLPIEHKSYWIFVVGAIALTIGCALLRFQIHSSDNYLFNQLLSALSGSRNVGSSSYPSLDFCFSSAECLAAIAIGYKLPALPRVFAFVQLYVVSMLIQWLLFSTLSMLGHPLSSVCTLTFGGLFGYTFRRLNIIDERFKTQCYELTLRNRELQEARLQLIKQDEIERRMLAADLHDQVLNDLKALKQNIEAYVMEPEQERYEKIQQLLQRAMSEVREVMDSLCPSALEHLGLPAAIEDCCRRGAQRSGFKVRFKNSANESLLDTLTVVEKSLLYRLVQESVTNICKHAEAKTVRTNLSAVDRNFLITIVDDGKGIAKDKMQTESRGLRYMRLRADLIGATVAWRGGEEDKGTIVEIRLEIANRNGHANTDS